METIVHNAIHVLLALALAAAAPGRHRQDQGRCSPAGSGRRVLQPYYDLIKLFRKGSVFSTTTTWVFRAGPVVGLVTAAHRGAAGPAGRRDARRSRSPAT